MAPPGRHGNQASPVVVCEERRVPEVGLGHLGLDRDERGQVVREANPYPSGEVVLAC